MPTVKTTAISVLCVDDNPQVLQALKAALTQSGYIVETAGDGWKALQRLRGNADRLRVVVTDVRMPGLTGVQMIRQSRALGYQGPFVVCAGGLAEEYRLALLELGVDQIIDKTAGIATLLAAVEQAAAAYNPAEAKPMAPPIPDADLSGDDEIADDGSFEEESGRLHHGP